MKLNPRIDEAKQEIRSALITLLAILGLFGLSVYLILR